MAKLIIQIEKGKSATDYRTNKTFMYDRLFTKVNGLTIPLKPGDTVAKDIIYEALEKRTELTLQKEKVEGVDQQGAPFSFESLYTLINEEKIPVKATAKTGKNLILKALEI